MEFETSNGKLTSLVEENIQYHDTFGISGSNVEYGFVPAFKNTSTGEIYRSRHSDGRPAQVHLYEGLPENLITKRDARKKPIGVEKTIVSGFIYKLNFYTRKQAIKLLTEM